MSVTSLLANGEVWRPDERRRETALQGLTRNAKAKRVWRKRLRDGMRWLEAERQERGQVQ